MNQSLRFVKRSLLAMVSVTVAGAVFVGGTMTITQSSAIDALSLLAGVQPAYARRGGGGMRGGHGGGFSRGGGSFSRGGRSFNSGGSSFRRSGSSSFDRGLGGGSMRYSDPSRSSSSRLGSAERSSLTRPSTAAAIGGGAVAGSAVMGSAGLDIGGQREAARQAGAQRDWGADRENRQAALQDRQDTRGDRQDAPKNRQENRQDAREKHQENRKEAREDWQDYRDNVREDRQDFYDDYGYWGWRNDGWYGFGAGLLIGAAIVSLPRHYEVVYVGGSPYYYYGGIYYVDVPAGGYEVVQAPISAVVEAPPEDCEVVTAGDETFCYYYGSFYFYNESQKTYQIVAAPAGATVSYLPEGYKINTVDGVNKYFTYAGVTYRPSFAGNHVVYIVADV